MSIPSAPRSNSKLDIDQAWHRLVAFISNLINVEVRDGVYAYLTVPAPTNCAVPGDWYFLEGTFSNEVMESWAIVPPLTYLGYQGSAQANLFEVEVHASLTSSHNQNLVHMAIFKNGNLEPNSQMCIFLKTSAEQFTVSLVDVISFAPGDSVDIRISSSVAANVTANHVTTKLNRFFGGATTLP